MAFIEGLDMKVLVSAGAERGWTPRYMQIEAIIESAWRWHGHTRY
jgi:UDP-glucose 4-epimerase